MYIYSLCNELENYELEKVDRHLIGMILCVGIFCPFLLHEKRVPNLNTIIGQCIFSGSRGRSGKYTINVYEE